MSEPVWYRSLYWRIAAGLVTVLAVMLLTQGLLFVYFTYPQAGSMQSRTPAQLAVIVATDLSTALARDPRADVEAFVHGQYDRAFQPVIVAMRDGRTVANHPTLVPPGLLAVVRRNAARGTVPPVVAMGDGRGPFRRPQPFGGEDGPEASIGAPAPAPEDADVEPRPPRPGGATGPGLPGPRRFPEFQPVTVGGEMVGLVAVLPNRPPFAMILTEVGPTMAVAGLGVLVLGGIVMAVAVFGPARRRLRHLQDATEVIGRGDFSARAPDDGGDEVAELSRSFNHMADELATREAALATANRARRQLLADVSHELMTPLTSMRGYLETLAMPELTLDAPTRERYVTIVTDETQRMEHIVGDLLELARLEGGSPTVRLTDVSIPALFERLIARHERELTSRHVSMTSHVSPGAAALRGDPERLEQALENLVANALRYTPQGGTIRLEAEHDAAHVRLRVRDNGPGIPEDHLSQVFDRFYKADAARRATGGSGLGLSIVKAIAERHGGTVTARNDGGAVFEIQLPRAGA